MDLFAGIVFAQSSRGQLDFQYIWEVNLLVWNKKLF